MRLNEFRGDRWIYSDAQFISPRSPATLAKIRFPVSGASLNASNQLLAWDDVGASLYHVWVGTSRGSHDLGMFPRVASPATNVVLEELPNDGRKIHVRLHSFIGGAWRYTESSFYASSPDVAPSVGDLIRLGDGKAIFIISVVLGLILFYLCA